MKFDKYSMEGKAAGCLLREVLPMREGKGIYE